MSFLTANSPGFFSICQDTPVKQNGNYAIYQFPHAQIASKTTPAIDVEMTPGRAIVTWLPLNLSKLRCGSCNSSKCSYGRCRRIRVVVKNKNVYVFRESSIRTDS